jgi:hypothetical protein
MLCQTHDISQDGLSIGRSFERLKNNVSYYDFNKLSNIDIIQIIKDNKPNLVFITGGKTLSPETLRKIKVSTDALVWWYSDAYVPGDNPRYEYIRENLPYFDLGFTSVRGLLNHFHKYNENIIHLPYYFDNYLYDTEMKNEKKIDIVFIGNLNKLYKNYRHSLLKAISKEYNLEIYGKNYGLNIPVVNFNLLGFLKITNFQRSLHNRYVYGKEMSNIYNKSKLSLNISSPSINCSSIFKISLEITGQLHPIDLMILSL